MNAASLLLAVVEVATRRSHARILLLLAAAAGLPALAGATGLNIVVYGGTGTIGQYVVSEALARGHTVTIVVRDVSAAAADKRQRLTIVKGDAMDSSDVATKVRRQDVVISAIKGTGQGDEFYRRAGQSYVAALRSLGRKAPRLIVVGGASSLEIAPGKLLLETQVNLPPGSDAYTQTTALEYYRTIDDVPWSFISPAKIFTRGTRTGKYRVGGDQLFFDANGQSVISMEDFAVAIIDEAERPQHLRRRFSVAY